MSFRLRILQMILCSVLLVCCGCFSGSGNIGEVEGVITLDGKPLDQTTIAFYPTEGRSSIGFTDAEGHYSLVHTRNENGAIIGGHKVTISTALEGSDQYDEVQTEGRKETMPRKYLNKKTTDLTAKVERGTNTINFDLKSADF